MPETPIEPLVDATRKATVHFAKAAFEVASGVGALMTGIVRTVRPETQGDERGASQHVPVE
jgi:hypothetical protein